MGTCAEGGRPGLVRLLEKEPTAAERYAHAAALIAILERRAGCPSNEPPLVCDAMEPTARADG